MAVTAQSIGAGGSVSASQISGLPTCGSGTMLTYTAGAFSCVAAASSSSGVGSCDASVTLIGGKTAAACCAAGGNVVSGGSGTFLCKISGSSCPAGWSDYQNWTTTSPMTYNDGSGCGSCSSLNHAFSNTATEYCMYSYQGAYTCTRPQQAFALVTERGCQ